MRVEINTHRKVVKSINYLSKQLERARLSKTKAILYFQVLLNEEQGGLVKRPHFTFTIDEFRRYLLFFERYNFFQNAFRVNEFSLSIDWKDKRERFVVPTEEEKDLLSLFDTHDELSSCFRISS